MRRRVGKNVQLVQAHSVLQYICRFYALDIFSIVQCKCFHSLDALIGLGSKLSLLRLSSYFI